MKESKYKIGDRDYFYDKFQNYLKEDKLNESDEGRKTLNLIISKIKSMGLEVEQNGSQIIISKKSGSRLLSLQIEWEN